MKKFFVFLAFFAFFGCQQSPFKEDTPKNGVVTSQNKAVCEYEEDFLVVFEKVKKALEECGEKVNKECLEKKIAWIETKKFKVTVEETGSGRVKVAVRSIVPRSKDQLSKIAKSIEYKVNSIEYNKEGKPVD